MNASDHRLSSLLLVVLGLAITLTMQITNGLPADPLLLLLPLGATVFLLLVALNTGALVGRLAGIAFSAGEEFLAGLLAISLWVLLLGSIHALYPLPLLAPLLVVLFTRRPRTHVIRISTLLDDARAFLSRQSRAEQAMLFLMLAGLSWAFLGALTLSIGRDALTYHLALPDQYLLRHSITPPGPGSHYLVRQQFGMVVAPFLLLDRSGQAVNLLNFLLLIVIVRGCYRLGSGGGSRFNGLLAAAAVATSPLLLKSIDLTSIDLLATALVIQAALLLGDSRPRGAVLFGLFCGGALAVTPGSAYAVLPLFTMLALREPRRLPPALLAAAPLPGFWLLREFLGSTPPFSIDAFAYGDAGSALYHLFVAFFTRFEGELAGPPGPALFFLAAAAFLGAARRPSLYCPPQAFALAGLASLTLWAGFFPGQVRLLPALLILWAAIGAAAPGELSRAMRIVLGVVLALTLGTSIAITEREDQVLMIVSRSRPLLDRMHFHLETFPLQVAADRLLPGEATVAVAGESALFYLHRRTDFNGPREPNRVLTWASASATPDQLRSTLRAHGYTHLFFNPRGCPPGPAVALIERMLASCPVVTRDSSRGASIHEL